MAKQESKGGEKPRAQVKRRLGNAGFWRLIQVQNLLANDQTLTAVSLAKRLECSARTIKRDIDELRDSYGAEIEWDGVAGAYRLVKTAELPLLQVGAEEAMALELAGGMLGAWWGNPLGQAMRSILEKLAKVAGNAITVPLASLQGCLFRPESTQAGAAQKRLLEAAMAAKEKRVTLMLYRKPGTDRADAREIHPLRVAYLDNDWMLVAYDVNRAALRNFLLNRIEDFVPGALRFVPPPETEIDAYLSGSVGRFSGSELKDVVLIFDEVAAPYILEKPWHPSQTTERLPGGRMQVRLRVNHLGDVQRAVLAWGRHAEALEPPELRAAVAAQVRDLAEKYFRESRGSDTP